MSIQRMVKLEYSANGQDWTPIYALGTSTAGVFVDTFHWLPPMPGVYVIRVAVDDNNNQAVGRTSIAAMALNR